MLQIKTGVQSWPDGPICSQTDFTFYIYFKRISKNMDIFNCIHVERAFCRQKLYLNGLNAYPLDIRETKMGCNKVFMNEINP